jgi:hypothetical protein
MEFSQTTSCVIAGLLDISQTTKLIGNLLLGFRDVQPFDFVLNAVRDELFGTAVTCGRRGFDGPLIKRVVQLDPGHESLPCVQTPHGVVSSTTGKNQPRESGESVIEEASSGHRRRGFYAKFSKDRWCDIDK